MSVRTQANQRARSSVVRKGHGRRVLQVRDCAVCGALFDARHSLPDLCPYCGGDPVLGLQTRKPRNTDLEVAAWLAGA